MHRILKRTSLPTHTLNFVSIFQISSFAPTVQMGLGIKQRIRLIKLSTVQVIQLAFWVKVGKKYAAGLRLFHLFNSTVALLLYLETSGAIWLILLRATQDSSGKN